MQLAIDAADDEPGIALAVDGVAALTATWVTQRNHSVELLPSIDRLLNEAGRTKDNIEAIFVDLGPGGYAALRVGVSVAKALAHGLSVPIVGIGRLELDAYAVAGDAGARRIVAVHRAGRGEAAWAAYVNGEGGWIEVCAPRIGKAANLHRAIERGDVVRATSTTNWPARSRKPRHPRHHRTRTASLRSLRSAISGWPQGGRVILRRSCPYTCVRPPSGRNQTANTARASQPVNIRRRTDLGTDARTD
jgi:tRNA threonylcarbamoyl adenosine modification protein YeaZ